MAKFCMKCGNPLQEGHKFCLNCGAPVAPAAPAGPVCAKCGNPLQEGHKFCLNCGTPVAAPAAEAAAPVVEAAAPVVEAAAPVVEAAEAAPEAPKACAVVVAELKDAGALEELVNGKAAEGYRLVAAVPNGVSNKATLFFELK